MGRPADESLPEVVPHQRQPFEVDHGSSPQVLSQNEATDLQWQAAERDKYPAAFDNAPKLPGEEPIQQWRSSSNPDSVTHTNSTPWESLPAGEPVAHNADNGQASKGRRICGLRRRTFLIAVVVAVIVIAATIGGAVGGTQAQRSASTAPPLFLNNQSSPAGLAFQAFSAPSYQGSYTPIIYEEGFHDFGFGAKSYVWLPNGTDCCITFCADKVTAVGWWCNPRYRTNASEPFPRVYVWCGRQDTAANETCS